MLFRCSRCDSFASDHDDRSCECDQVEDLLTQQRDAARAEADTLRRQVEALRAALAKFGGHASGCTYEGFTWTSAQRVYGPTSHCTCGLDAALAARTP
jgi:hypothetical protein